MGKRRAAVVRVTVPLSFIELFALMQDAQYNKHRHLYLSRLRFFLKRTVEAQSKKEINNNKKCRGK